MAERITKPGTVENFVKDLHPVRISPEATTVYMDELDKLTKSVTDKAVALMQLAAARPCQRRMPGKPPGPPRLLATTPR